MTKLFWILIIALVIIAILVYVLFMYYEVIINSILGLFQGIIDYFVNLFTGG